ncbi:hypothetical protein ABZ864_36140 [Streptomyces sp. NPDC047082]|uniref:hypothetical protein n=1 Tax=Streptomyces sp. NPDC047082 TaxID=3155259 RepID=UPI003407C6AF
MSDGPQSTRGPAGRHELYSEDAVMGAADRRRRLESAIRFGHATVMDADAETLDRLVHQVGWDRWAYSYVTFPYDLDRLGDGARYERLRLTVTYRHPRVLGAYLAPSHDNTDVPISETIVTYGVGQPRMTWDFSPCEGNVELAPHGRVVHCLVRRPPEVEQVEVVLEAEVTIVRQLLVLDRRNALFREPGHYLLSFTEGTFEPFDPGLSFRIS